jgi:hypothetical protein
MQLSFNAIWILGSIAIFLHNPYISIGYIVVFPFFGIIFCIMHLWICSRCPHIKNHSACVQLHPFLTKRIIKKNIYRPIHIYEKVGFFFFLYGIAAFPVFWIIKSELLAIFYFTFVIMHYIAYPFYFCRKCLNISCPQNMTRGEMGRKQGRFW